MKYKEIIKIIKNISLALPDVQSFYTGDVYEVNADQSVKYSSVVLTNQEHSFDNINDKFQYNFILFYIDRLTDDEANRTDVHTAAVSALKNIVRHLEDYDVIINDFKFNLFRERFNDSCAGAYASLSVDVEDNDCNEDFDFTYGQISADKLKEISITSNGTYTPDEGYYYTKIDVNVPIPEPKLGSLVATENNKWYMASSENLDGYEVVNVSVPEPKLIDHTAIYAENGSYSLTPKNADGFSKVNVRVNVPDPALTVLNTTENGHYEAIDSGFYGYSAVEVNVPTPTFETAELVATENGIYRASEQGVDGFYAVMVDVPTPEFTTEELNATNNGTYTPSTDGYSKVSVNVQPNLQAKSKTTTITANGTSTITLQPDANYDGLSSASVTITTNVESSGGGTTSKFIVPYGLKFGGSTAFNSDMFDISNVTDMSNMFVSSGDLTSLDLSNWNVRNVTDMSYMFYNCSHLASLNISTWKTSNVTDMSYMFYWCGSLQTLNIDKFNTSNVTNMSYMFYRCSKLTSLNLNNWDTLKVTEMNDMFWNCFDLTDLDLGGCNMSNVKNKFNDVANMNSMFYNCVNLANLNMDGAILPKTDLSTWDIDTCTALTIVSLESVLNALPQLPDGTSYTCSLGSTNLAKLSDEQIAIATNKNWVLS